MKIIVSSLALFFSLVSLAYEPPVTGMVYEPSTKTVTLNLSRKFINSERYYESFSVTEFLTNRHQRAISWGCGDHFYMSVPKEDVALLLFEVALSELPNDGRNSPRIEKYYVWFDDRVPESKRDYYRWWSGRDIEMPCVTNLKITVRGNKMDMKIPVPLTRKYDIMTSTDLMNWNALTNTVFESDRMFFKSELKHETVDNNPLL